MIRVNENGVELTGGTSNILNELTLIMLAIRDFAYPFCSEDKMDELLHEAVETSKCQEDVLRKFNKKMEMKK